MKKFEHGGNIEEFAQNINCSVEEVIDLSSNINFLKPSISVDFNTLNISSYPNYENLYEKIAKNYGITKDELELFNGGSSAIFSLFKHLKLNTCVIYSPAYLEYKKACVNFNYDLQLINRFENIHLPIKKDSLVIFVNPSTPDGKYYQLEELINYWIAQNSTILIDESFLDFCDKDSAINYLQEYDKLYILKSMTKFYSSGGIRVGCIISSKNNIKNLKKNEPMWKLSQFDSLYLQNALEDTNFKNISKSINIKNMLQLKNILHNCTLVEKVYETKANYFLIKLKNINAKEFQEILKPHKILIRDCSNFDFLDEYYVRIAIKSSKINDILKKALNNYAN